MSNRYLLRIIKKCIKAVALSFVVYNWLRILFINHNDSAKNKQKHIFRIPNN